MQSVLAVAGSRDRTQVFPVILVAVPGEVGPGNGPELTPTGEAKCPGGLAEQWDGVSLVVHRLWGRALIRIYVIIRLLPGGGGEHGGGLDRGRPEVLTLYTQL